jgi:general transcription factor 3C polypeptide 5 (transcription factor C subunit 1)
MDNPAELLRALKDNVGKYKVDAVGQVNQTHRFRGMASTSFGFDTY